MNAVADSVPPLLPGRKPRRWPWIAGVACALVGVAIFALVYRKFPSDEERKYFGWWYGMEMEDETAASSWAAEFREDGTLRIKFGRYHRVNADKAWQFSSVEEIGRWRVRDGVQHLSTDDPEHPPNWFTRLERWQETGDTRRQHYYRTTSIDAREMNYLALPAGPDFHALHSQAPVELPTEPLPPEKWPTTAPRPRAN